MREQFEIEFTGRRRGEGSCCEIMWLYGDESTGRLPAEIRQGLS